jgi:hypothetical protein
VSKTAGGQVIVSEVVMKSCGRIRAGGGRSAAAKTSAQQQQEGRLKVQAHDHNHDHDHQPFLVADSSMPLVSPVPQSELSSR